MRRCPCTLLVCLGVLIVFNFTTFAQADDFISINVTPENNFSTNYSTDQEQPAFVPAAARNRFSFVAPVPPIKPISKVKTTAPCPPMQPCAMPPKCILPTRMPGQWEIGVQVFFANFHGVVKWPAIASGQPTTQLDANDDLGLPRYKTLLEYGARYQFRPHWALFYTIMPVHLEGNQAAPRSFYYGQYYYPAGTPLNTKWDFIYQRVGLIYQPIVSCNLNLSVYASWSFTDQRVDMKSGVCGGRCCTMDRTRNQVMAGVELQKCIKTMCNGATLSCDNKVGLAFLDGTFGLDVQTGLRFSVPMGAGRWGYAKGGYRLLDFQEDRNDLRLDGRLEGGFAELGLIF